MELVVVAGIIVALLALTFALYRRVQNQAETAESRERMELIRNSLGGYFVEHGAYPAGLSAVLASLPISIPRNTDGEPLDPWGHPYSYTSTTNPAGERLVYNLSSPGPTDDPGDDLVMGP
jgi:type II secretory pathway pseudopilin PulG